MNMLMAGSRRGYAKRVQLLFSSRIYRYLPMWESAGSAVQDLSPNLANAAYAGGVTLGAAGIGDKRTAVTLDGTGRVNPYSAAFVAGFPLTELTISVWISIAAAQWADATLRYLCGFRADASNRMGIEKSVTANTLLFRYYAGGVSKVVTASAVTSEALQNLTMTVSASNDRLRGYVNGSKVGADVTGLGVWAGALASPYTAFGSDRNSAGSHVGGMAHGLILTGEASAAEVAALASPFEGGPAGLLTVGDSKTASASPGVQALVAALRERGQGWFEAARLAVSGIDTVTMRGRIDADLAAVEADNLARVRVILYNLGANDNNSAPAYAAFVADTVYCLLALHAACPGALIYMARVWERGSQVWLDDVQRVAVADLAAVYPWVRAGIDERLTLEAGDDGATWTADGTHPTNPAGYVREWADAGIGWLARIQ
jgi:hypothetical protein